MLVFEAGLLQKMDIVKLKPSIKDYIWGGHKLSAMGKSALEEKIAETWELSLNKDGPSFIATGSDQGKPLMDVATNEDLGSIPCSFRFFPVLIKLIDAAENLSVQVHPSDEYALKNEGQYGKTEMWYVIASEPHAGLYIGFKKKTSPQEVEAAIAAGSIIDLLNFVEVHPGETYFIKAGTVHAIGKGVMVMEIQQNSTLTYRLFDYNRLDKNGQKRELHVAKALQVLDYEPYRQPHFKKPIIGSSSYFTSSLGEAKQQKRIAATNRSFVSLTIVDEGEGTFSDIPYHRGDTFFVPAGHVGVFHGTGHYVKTELLPEKEFIGIDIGGTSIKGAFVRPDGKILSRFSFPVDHSKSQEEVIDELGLRIKKALGENSLWPSDILGIGIGCPGSINSKKGCCDYSNNLQWENLAICKMIKKRTGIRTRIANDANAAILGEVRFGAAREFKNVVLLTLGTGVGGGLYLNGHLYEGTDSKGAELGHATLVMDGRPCTCGRNGCIEAYCSASALIDDTKKMMKSNRNSLMWTYSKGDLKLVDGLTAFECAKKGDESAKRVVDQYIKYLGESCLSYINIFRPDAIILGGGISGQKEALIVPLTKYIEKEHFGFGGEHSPRVRILVSKLGNDAGILGAAALLIH